MTVYSPELHTPEALGEELERMFADAKQMRLAGSLGRAVIFNEIYGDPEYEYRMRGQAPLAAGHKARDIDVIDLITETAEPYKPFAVDFGAFDDPLVSLKRQGDEWFIVSDYHNFAEPLHPDVMAPVEGETVYGIPATTVSAQTLRHLYGLRGALRRKDKITKGLLVNACDDVKTINKLSDELFIPFRQIEEISHASNYVRLQNVYRRFVPEAVREKALPFVGVFKQLYFNRLGNQ